MGSAVGLSRGFCFWFARVVLENNAGKSHDPLLHALHGGHVQLFFFSLSFAGEQGPRGERGEKGTSKVSKASKRTTQIDALGAIYLSRLIVTCNSLTDGRLR